MEFCFVNNGFLVNSIPAPLYIHIYIYIYIYIYSRWERDFPSIQTDHGAHPASCKMGTVYFPAVNCGRGVLLATHPFYCRGHGRVDLYFYPPSGPHRVCNGILYVYIYIYIHVCLCVCVCVCLCKCCLQVNQQICNHLVGWILPALFCGLKPLSNHFIYFML